MQLKTLTREMLIHLKLQGFNVLTYNNKISDNSIIWFPEVVEDVYEYITGLCDLGMLLFDEPNILVIDEAIDNIAADHLVGEVLCY